MSTLTIVAAVLLVIILAVMIGMSVDSEAQRLEWRQVAEERRGRNEELRRLKELRRQVGEERRRLAEERKANCRRSPGGMCEDCPFR